MVRVIQEYKIHRELNDKWKYFIPDNEKKILTTKKNTIHYGKGRVYPPITAYRLV